MSKIRIFLQNNPIFNRLGDNVLEELERYAELIILKKNAVVYVAGDPSDRVLFVCEGRVKLSRSSSDGRELILDILISGDMFGEMAVCGEQRRNQSAVAIDDTLVCAFKRQDFIKTMYDCPLLAHNLLCYSERRRNELELRLEDLVFLPVGRRLLLTLLRQAERHGVIQKDGSVSLHLTQKDIAHLSGASRETIAELLSLYRKQGMVETGYRSIRLVNPKKTRKDVTGRL